MLRHNIVSINDLKKIKIELLEEYERVTSDKILTKYLIERNHYIRKFYKVKSFRYKNFNAMKLNALHRQFFQKFYTLYITAFKMLYAEHGVLTREEIVYLEDFYDFLGSMKLY